MTGYTDTIRRYAAGDRWVGLLDDADGTGEVGLSAEEAGRKLAVRFTLRSRSGLIETIRFQVFGCGFTIAACAAAAKLSEGRTLQAALDLDSASVDAALGGLPQERAYCAALAVEALHAAVLSAQNGSAVQTSLHPAGEDDHGPRLDARDPIYRALMQSPCPSAVEPQDRHLFACLLAAASQETRDIPEALGLGAGDVDQILRLYFPGFDAAHLLRPELPHPLSAPQINEEVLEILLSHVPKDSLGFSLHASLWLARMLAARAAHTGHLWVAMGLFERPQLTAAIRRHLPSLAEANNKGMRWKRYLFKQVCEAGGGMLCKSPNCGVCSDYALCFDPH